MESIGAPTGMLLVILPSKLPLGRELHPTVVQETITMHSGVVLWGTPAGNGVWKREETE